MEEKIKKEIKNEEEHSEYVFNKIIHILCATNGYFDVTQELIDSAELNKKQLEKIYYMRTIKKSTGTYPRYKELTKHFSNNEDIDLDLPVYYSCEKDDYENGKFSKSNRMRNDFESIQEFVREFLNRKKRILLLKNLDKNIDNIVENRNIDYDFSTTINNLQSEMLCNNIKSNVLAEAEERCKIYGTVLKCNENLRNGIIGKNLITISGSRCSYTIYFMDLLKQFILNNHNIVYISFNTINDVSCARVVSSLSQELTGIHIPTKNFFHIENNMMELSAEAFKKFRETYEKKIYFIGNENLQFKTIDYLNNIIYEANKKFTKETLEPISAIFVEGLEDALLEKNGKEIINSSEICSSYTRAFKNYSEKLNIPVMVFTNQIGKGIVNMAKKNYFLEFSEIVTGLDILSDMCIVCRVERNKNSAEMISQILKSRLCVQNEPIHEEIELQKYLDYE